MCKNHRNPLRCIIPPYIAEKLLDTPVMEETQALDALLRNHRFHSDRKFFSALPPAARKMTLIKAQPVSPVKPSIELYDCQHTTQLPGRRLNAAAIEQDKDAKNVYTASEYTWDFYNRFFNRKSIDNANMVLVHSIHYGRDYPNAMWNGRQMVYGDGDQETFGSFTDDIDVIAHELAHGVTQYEANLEYEFQSGALNESFSDVFGIMIKQFVRNETVNKSNWLIGENVMLGEKYALRSMIAPGTAYLGHPQWGDDPQPATMDNYLHFPNTEEGDWGGVHYNSGIPNFAFCMAAMEAGGYAWETVGRVWYAALTESLQRYSDFADAKEATILHAGKIFGTGSKVEKAVINGWRKAKV